MRGPASIAADTRIRRDAEVGLSIDQGRLIISPAAPEAIALAELGEDVTLEACDRADAKVLPRYEGPDPTGGSLRR